MKTDSQCSRHPSRIAKEYGDDLTTGNVTSFFAKRALEYGIDNVGDEYATPPAIFNPLNDLFDFDVDVAATAKNTKVQQNFFTLKQDGLKQDWTKFKSVWCNPPFSDLLP